MLQSMGSQRVGHDRANELNRHYQLLCTESSPSFWTFPIQCQESSVSYGLMELIPVNMFSLLFFSFLVEEIQTHKKNGMNKCPCAHHSVSTINILPILYHLFLPPNCSF